MTAADTTAYRAGEPVVWTEPAASGYPTIRHCEFIDTNGPTARIRWAGEAHQVPLEQLSKPQPPQQSLPHHTGFFTVKPPPTPPSEEQLTERLAAARVELRQRQDVVKQARDKLESARSISARADRELNDARATLATLDAHDRAQQNEFELAIQLGRPIPQRLNGHDRNYIVQRVTSAEQAQRRFNAGLAECTALLSEALSAVRKAAAQVISVMLERETENLRAAESRAAVLRAELTAVSNWWPSSDTGALKIGAAAAACLEAAQPWQENVQVRAGADWIKEWQSLHDRLCQDAESDFELLS